MGVVKCCRVLWSVMGVVEWRVVECCGVGNVVECCGVLRITLHNTP